MNIPIGSAIREAREADPKWNQDRLAREAGVSRDTVRRAEADEDVRLTTLVQIARALDQKTGGHLLNQIVKDVDSSALESLASGAEKKSDAKAQVPEQHADSSGAHNSASRPQAGGSPVDDPFLDQLLRLYGAVPVDLRPKFLDDVEDVFDEVRALRKGKTHPKRRRPAK